MSNVPELVHASAELTVQGYQVRIEMDVPTAPKRPIHLLPLFQSVANALVEVGVSLAEADGHTVSCTKGCGACCRQLVPISPCEARRIRELVDELPEPRRSEIRARFSAARARLEPSGLTERLRDPARIGRTADALALEYLRQGIACPFLEEESCSIHVDRPLACREYLVTSPAKHCEQPTAATVRCVTMPIEASRAVMQMEPTSESYGAPWVTLTLALDWAEAHPDQAPEKPGPELVREFFSHLSEAPLTPETAPGPGVAG
jgi:Fe-S-cluster containining protein